MSGKTLAIVLLAGVAGWLAWQYAKTLPVQLKFGPPTGGDRTSRPGTPGSGTTGTLGDRLRDASEFIDSGANLIDDVKRGYDSLKRITE